VRPRPTSSCTRCRLSDRPDRLDATIDAGGDVLQRRLSVLDDLAENRQRQQPVVAALFENDLRERHRRQIFAASLSSTRTSSPCFTKEAIASRVT
jgi:hypothetical protein